MNGQLDTIWTCGDSCPRTLGPTPKRQNKAMHLSREMRRFEIEDLSSRRGDRDRSSFKAVDPHSMLLIVIIAFIATVGFFRRAKEIGIHPGKAASVPFIAAGLMIAVTYLSALVIGRLFSVINFSMESARWFGFAMDLFLVLAYLIFIKRNWDILCAVDFRDPASDPTAANGDLSV
jgi:hypothetical protein